MQKLLDNWEKLRIKHFLYHFTSMYLLKPKYEYGYMQLYTLLGEHVLLTERIAERYFVYDTL